MNAVYHALPLPGGERAGVRGSEARPSVSAIGVVHPHPTLSLEGEGSNGAPA